MLLLPCHYQGKAVWVRAAGGGRQGGCGLGPGVSKVSLCQCVRVGDISLVLVFSARQ